MHWAIITSLVLLLWMPQVKLASPALLTRVNSLNMFCFAICHCPVLVQCSRILTIVPTSLENACVCKEKANYA